MSLDFESYLAEKGLDVFFYPYSASRANEGKPLEAPIPEPVPMDGLVVLRTASAAGRIPVLLRVPAPHQTRYRMKSLTHHDLSDLTGLTLEEIRFMLTGLRAWEYLTYRAGELVVKHGS